MDEMENVFSSLSGAIFQSITELNGCKDVNEKKTRAEIVKMLCESMGIFIQAVEDDCHCHDDVDEDDFDDDDDDFPPDDMPGKNSGRNGGKQIPF
jgi:hypothetical protein